MTTLKNTKENAAIISTLKGINETKWVGNTTHPKLSQCLAAINLHTFNSGWYLPAAVRVNGLRGLYLVNQDGSLCWEFRVIESGDSFRIESLSDSGMNEFEKRCSQFFAENI
jgi:hypothetical protein